MTTRQAERLIWAFLKPIGFAEELYLRNAIEAVSEEALVRIGERLKNAEYQRQYKLERQMK